MYTDSQCWHQVATAGEGVGGRMVEREHMVSAVAWAYNGGLGTKPPVGSGAETLFGVEAPWSWQLLSTWRQVQITHLQNFTLVEKNGFPQWVGSDPLRQARLLHRHLLFLHWQLTKMKYSFSLSRSFEILNAIVQTGYAY